METKRGREVISKRDIAKKKRASHSPKTNTKKGNSHSLERKIAALKDVEERSEMELNKPLKFFEAKDYKKIPPKKNRSPRKQTNSKKSLTKLTDKTADILDSSSEGHNEIIQQETKKENTTEENKTTNKTNKTQIAPTGMAGTSWYQKSKSQRERCRKQMNRS